MSAGLAILLILVAAACSAPRAIPTTALLAVAALPASARAWLADQLRRRRDRRHAPPTTDQGA